MTTVHDDRPHPIPPFAYLRYKENYFFIVMDPEREVFGVSHLNNEPLFNRSRFTLNLNIRGKHYSYTNETPLPARFELADELSDGRLTLRFVEPHRRFDLSFHGDELSADLVFEARRPTFNYAACKTAAPELPSFQEVMTLGLNLPYNHQQQSLTARGSVTVKSAQGETPIRLDGLGYRDHSWSVRTDNIVRSHFWTGMNFPGRAIGMKTIDTMHRPGLVAKEGYVSDQNGERALRAIAVREYGSKDGWPESLRFELRDVLGQPFTVEVDVAGRYADVPLHAEKPAPGQASYHIIEACCPLRLVETGEQGVGLIEIGKHPSLGRG